MRTFTCTRQDPRRLNMLDHERLRQTHGERRRIHGPIRPMPPSRRPRRRPSEQPWRGGTWQRLDLVIACLGFAVALFCIGYFAAQLLRPAA